MRWPEVEVKSKYLENKSRKRLKGSRCLSQSHVSTFKAFIFLIFIWCNNRIDSEKLAYNINQVETFQTLIKSFQRAS